MLLQLEYQENLIEFTLSRNKSQAKLFGMKGLQDTQGVEEEGAKGGKSKKAPFVNRLPW